MHGITQFFFNFNFNFRLRKTNLQLFLYNLFVVYSMIDFMNGNNSEYKGV